MKEWPFIQFWIWMEWTFHHRMEFHSIRPTKHGKGPSFLFLSHVPNMLLDWTNLTWAWKWESDWSIHVIGKDMVLHQFNYSRHHQYYFVWLNSFIYFLRFINWVMLFVYSLFTSPFILLFHIKKEGFFYL